LVKIYRHANGISKKNFSAKDLFDPNKFSASNLNNLKVGDVLYRANIINQDEIDDWEMKYQKADEAGKKKLLQNQPTPQEDVDLGIYLGEGKVSTMVNDKEGGKGNGSRIISLEDFRATGAATSKEAKENAKTTNDTIDTRIKDTIDSMVLLHGQDKESYGAIEKAVKDSSWSDVDKKSALDYLSKIVQNGLGGGSGSGSGTGGLNPTLGAGTGNDFGSLARDYESDGDVGAITLADSRGTSAFGLYQFNSGGQLPDLMSYIAKQNPDFFNKYFGSDVWNAMDESGKGFKDSAFVNAWKSAAMYDPTVFGQLQQNYGVKTNYTDVIEPFKNQFGIDLTQRSRALQEAIMSTEIQHGAGGAWDVFKDALNKYGKDANNISDEQLLRDIYASRSDNNPSSSSRYVNELNSALVMLQQYGLKPENDPNAFYLPVDKLNISSGFMDTKNRTKPHQGIDLAGNPEGSDIYAAKGGTITKVLPTDQSNGYGNMVVITDENGNQYTYGHMQDGSLDSLKEGMDISAGQVIGHVGSTGNSTGPHLHFEMKDANGKVIDPTNYITNAQKPSYVDNELFSNPSVPVTPSGNPSDLLMPGTGKLVGNVFTDGSLMYDYLPASLRSSYMTNDANTKFSLLNEAKAIRSAYGNNPDPTYDVQAMAATNRLDFDKQIFSNSGVRNDFTTDYQLPYGTELSSVSGLVSSGASGSSPTFSVKFNYDSQGVDDIAFNSFVKRVQGFIESIGGQVEQVQDDLGTVKTSVKVVADNVDTLTTKITNDSKF
jgi:murein DD-endopeptidase MepM/ murein hydrolase activator NlpD